MSTQDLKGLPKQNSVRKYSRFSHTEDCIVALAKDPIVRVHVQSFSSWKCVCVDRKGNCKSAVRMNFNAYVRACSSRANFTDVWRT